MLIDLNTIIHPSTICRLCKIGIAENISRKRRLLSLLLAELGLKSYKFVTRNIEEDEFRKKNKLNQRNV
jgi:hypothetical protein